MMPSPKPNPEIVTCLRTCGEGLRLYASQSAATAQRLATHAPQGRRQEQRLSRPAWAMGQEGDRVRDPRQCRQGVDWQPPPVPPGMARREAREEVDRNGVEQRPYGRVHRAQSPGGNVVSMHEAAEAVEAQQGGQRETQQREQRRHLVSDADHVHEEPHGPEGQGGGREGQIGLGDVAQTEDTDGYAKAQRLPCERSPHLVLDELAHRGGSVDLPDDVGTSVERYLATVDAHDHVVETHTRTPGRPIRSRLEADHDPLHIVAQPHEAAVRPSDRARDSYHAGEVRDQAVQEGGAQSEIRQPAPCGLASRPHSSRP